MLIVNIFDSDNEVCDGEVGIFVNFYDNHSKSVSLTLHFFTYLSYPFVIFFLFCNSCLVSLCNLAC